MTAEDEILALARKLVELERQSAQIAAERRITLALYRQRIDELRGTDSSVTNSANGGASLRERIQVFLTNNPGVPMSLDDIEREVGSPRSDRRRVIWTLANMRRDGVVKREGRGIWSSEPEPPVLDEDDISF